MRYNERVIQGRYQENETKKFSCQKLLKKMHKKYWVFFQPEDRVEVLPKKNCIINVYVTQAALLWITRQLKNVANCQHFFLQT